VVRPVRRGGNDRPASSDDDVDHPARHDDDLLRRAAVDRGGDLLVGEGGGLDRRRIGVGGDEIQLPGPFGMPRLIGGDLDEDSLKAIAHKTGGRYFRADDLPTLAQIYALLDKIEPLSKDQQSWRPVEELYGWPLGAALLLSVLIALSAGGLLPRLGRTGVSHA